MPFLDSYFDAPIAEDMPPADLTDLYVTPDTAADDPSGGDGGMSADSGFTNIETEDVFLFIDYFPPSGTANSTGPEPEPLPDEAPEKPDFPTEAELFDMPARHSATRAMLLRWLVHG